MIKNIIFDLGGVVFNWDPKRVAEEFKHPDLDAQTIFESDFFTEHWSEFDRGIYAEEELLSILSLETGFPLQACEDFLDYIKSNLHDISETINRIKTLHQKGYHLLCLSNLSHEFYDFLKSREVFKYFHEKVISAQEEMIKPDPALFQLTLDRYKLIPQETLFIDDLPANTAAAQSLGIQTLTFDTPENKAKAYKVLDLLKKLEQNSTML